MRTVCQALRALAAAPKTVTVGFDGFADTVARPVRTAAAPGREAVCFATIAEFGAYLMGQAEQSCSVELAVSARQLGGNLPHLSRAAGRLGLEVSCVGMLGEPGRPDPLFADMPCRLYPFAPPGAATALEFSDGKVFLAEQTAAPEDVWRFVTAAVPETASLFAQADLCALVNWSELSFAQALWQAVYDHAFRDAPEDWDRFVFFDLCDCGRKSPEELDAVLTLLGRFAEKRTAILSLNENEARLVCARVLGGVPPLEAGPALRDQYGISQTIVHTLRKTVLSTPEETVSEDTLFVAQPRISTGGGDHFNAASCLGALLGLTAEQRVALANRYVHAYITQGVTPNLADLTALFENESL